MGKALKQWIHKYCVELIYSPFCPLQWVVDGGHGEGLCPFWSRQVWKLWGRKAAFIMWAPRSHLALFQVLVIPVAAVPTHVSTSASSALPLNKDGRIYHLHFNLAAVWQFHQLEQQRSHTRNDYLLSEYALGGNSQKAVVGTSSPSPSWSPVRKSVDHRCCNSPS